MKYVVDFGAWAYEKYRRFKKAQELDPSLACVVSPSSHTTVIINMKSGKTSFSKCRKCDTFHASTGLGVAWARYIGEEIPKQAIQTTISKLTPGDKFYFSRGNHDKKYYYIGYDPVHNASVFVSIDTEDIHWANLNTYVIKI